MANNTTWGVKCSEEIKEKLSKLMEESGLTGDGFAEVLANAYLLNILKDKQPTITPDIEELQSLVNRIVSIYINAGERIETLMRDKDDMHKIELEGKESLIVDYNGRIKQLENKLDLILAESVEKDNAYNELKRYSDELENSAAINKELIIQYKEKNDALTGIVSQYQSYKDEFDKKDTEVKNLTNEINTLKFELNKTNTLIDELNKSHPAKIAEIEKSNKSEMDLLTKKLEIEKDNEILNIKTEYQAKLEKYQNENNLLHDNYNSRIKDLLDTIDAQKKEPKKKEPKSRKPKI